MMTHAEARRAARVGETRSGGWTPSRRGVVRDVAVHPWRRPEAKSVGSSPAGHDLAALSVHGPMPMAGSGASPGIGAQPPPTPDALVPDASVPAPSPSPSAAATPTAPVAPSLTWTHVLRHRFDALWFFCGERPSGFSTTATLRASGHTDPTQLSWSISQGSDKVGFTGAASGAQVDVESKKGSARANDVEIEIREGVGPAVPAYTGRLTVRKPHRLISRATTDNGACPPWAGCSVACGQYWTTLDYRVVDNVGGTVVGATVNEHFPGAKANDQANNWVSPAAFITTPFWPDTNGTFVDNWFVSCGAPAPVAPGNALAGQGVDRIPHEFYVGSRTPGRGCIVQRHTAHRYQGRTRHEGITSPVP